LFAKNFLSIYHIKEKHPVSAGESNFENTTMFPFFSQQLKSMPDSSQNDMPMPEWTAILAEVTSLKERF